MKVALIFFLFGVLSGAIYGMSKFVVFVFKNNMIVQIVIDLIYSLGVGYSILIATNKLLYGEIRLYIIAAFVLGMWLERKTFGKLFAKVYLLVYNVGIKLVKRIKTTKLGKVIFK